jgi:hypothetical protein
VIQRAGGPAPESESFAAFDVPAPVAKEMPPAVAPADPPSTIVDLLVKRGDTLEILFRRNGLSLTDLAAMVALPDASGALKILKPGDRLEIAHRDGQVLSLRREILDFKVLSIAREESGFAANTIQRDVDVRITSGHGGDSKLPLRGRLGCRHLGPNDHGHGGHLRMGRRLHSGRPRRR